MSDEQEKPYLHESGSQWDWWGENPAEIVLVVFLLAAFAFFYSLPSQGWGIDPNPRVVEPVSASPHAGE